MGFADVLAEMEIEYDSEDALLLAKAFGQTIQREAWLTSKIASEALTSKRPDILVLIAYPDFNLMLAKHAKAAGIPVLYYVSPQVWAWRRSRIKKIAALANRMAVLFPFEIDFYKDTSLPCEFVGHPILETLNLHQSKEELKNVLGLDPAKGVVTLLPGSRPNELSRHQDIIREVAEKIHQDFPDMQIVVPLVSGSRLSEDLPAYVKVPFRSSSKFSVSQSSAFTGFIFTFT